MGDQMDEWKLTGTNPELLYNQSILDFYVNAAISFLYRSISKKCEVYIKNVFHCIFNNYSVVCIITLISCKVWIS